MLLLDFRRSGVLTTKCRSRVAALSKRKSRALVGIDSGLPLQNNILTHVRGIVRPGELKSETTFGVDSITGDDCMYALVSIFQTVNTRKMNTFFDISYPFEIPLYQ